MAINSRFVVASIEARMTSTRLPGKVLMPCVGRPMLELMVERVRRSRYVDAIVVATTVNVTDDPIVHLAQKLGIRFFRGSESNVVERVTTAMKEVQADIIVQLTSDCPLIDHEIIDQLLRIYASNEFDHVSNTILRSYPDGLDVQVSSLPILEKCCALCENDKDREHLFYTIRKNRDKIKTFQVLAPDDLCWPQWRWTLDTPDDYRLICRIYEHFYVKNPAFSSRDIARFMLSEVEPSS
ncbi:MAG: glycosyltransferase family protein [Verrucomicrobia bacterium]|nr:glycosyltransferase family protein [Verrucomicrobiota bacterium]